MTYHLIKWSIAKVGPKSKYQQTDSRNINVKYQSSSTHCLKVINYLKVSDRFTQQQNDRMKKWQTAVNINSYSIFKKKHAYPPSFLHEIMIKTTLLSW